MGGWLGIVEEFVVVLGVVLFFVDALDPDFVLYFRSRLAQVRG